MKFYRHSRYRGCALCKPHKAGFERRFKVREEHGRRIARSEMSNAIRQMVRP